MYPNHYSILSILSFHYFTDYQSTKCSHLILRSWCLSTMLTVLMRENGNFIAININDITSRFNGRKFEFNYSRSMLFFMSRPVWPAGHYVSGLSVLPSRFRGTTLRAAPANYHACIAMPTWPRCAPPILCWPWPPYNLFPRLCLTFFVDPHWWTPLCVQRPAKAMPFQQIIMHKLHCQHDVDVHLLFSFDLDILLSCSWGHV